MQLLQKKWRAEGSRLAHRDLVRKKGSRATWTRKEENAYVKSVGADPTAVILDSSGSIGHLYDAKDDAADGRY